MAPIPPATSALARTVNVGGVVSLAAVGCAMAAASALAGGADATDGAELLAADVCSGAPFDEPPPPPPQAASEAASIVAAMAVTAGRDGSKRKGMVMGHVEQRCAPQVAGGG